MKKILYVDMDGVLVDFKTALPHVRPELLKKFAGEHIHFGSEKYPDWPKVMEYLRPRAVQQI